MIVTRDGLRLAYETVGNGPLLVCQPGGPGRASRYLRDLAGLTATRTLVRYDAAGTGASDRPDDTGRLRYTELAGDLDDVRRHLGLETFDLIAHSAGAVVAQAYAATHPDRVRRLVLVTPSGGLHGVHGEDVSRPETYGTWDEKAQDHASTVDEEMDRTAERSFQGEPRPDLVAALRAVESPVLVVAGGADRLTPVAAAEAVAASFPHAALHVLPHIGHYPWIEAPEEFARLVEGFLAKGE